jgi:hypothetical protein
VRSAGSVEDTVKALAASPYAGNHYGGGASLLAKISTYKLKQYDGIVSVDSANTVDLSKVNIPDLSQMDNKQVMYYALVGVSVLALLSVVNK